jgi:L-asparaginase
MQNSSFTDPPVVVVLGTGGTIAGTSARSGDDIGYSAAQIGAAQLIAALPALAGQPIEVEQIAQIDSKNMSTTVWRALAVAVARHLARPEVGGVVVTHGTDTLEETAYFLQRLLAPTKPVVLAAAMRPATSLQADGPQNLLDALTVARQTGAHGVVAVLAGRVHSALDLRKLHPYRLDAFGSGDAGAVAEIESGRLRVHRAWPGGSAIGIEQLPAEGAAWPWVEIVTSHADARGNLVNALRAAGVAGIVVAGTGNGSIHALLEAALIEARAVGVAVLRCTRCLGGSVIEADGAIEMSDAPLPSAGALTPFQARVELQLRLLAARTG